MLFDVSDIIFVLTSLAVNGTLASLFWKLSQKLIERQGYWKPLFIVLKGMILAFVVPWQYLILKVMQLRFSMYWCYLLVSTPIIRVICWLCLVLWSVFFVWRMVVQYHERRIIRSAEFFFRELPPEKMMIYEEACSFLEVKRSPEVVCSSLNQMPHLTTTCPTRIILPETLSESDGLRTAILHELVHFRHRDHIWKRLLLFLNLIHGWNPMYICLREQFIEWAEYACDHEISCLTHNTGEYYRMIVHIREKVCHPGPALDSQLFDGRIDMDRRMSMTIKRRDSGIRRVMILLLSASLVSFSLLCTFGATVLAGEGYYSLYYMTSEETEAELLAPNSVSRHETGFAADVQVIEGETEAVEKITGLYQFEWTVPNLVAVKSGSHALSAGDSVPISLLLISPAGSLLKVGIVKTGSEEKTYNLISSPNTVVLTVPASGAYSVFVENRSGLTVKVIGSYYIP